LSLLLQLDQLWLCGSKHSSLRSDLSREVLQQCQIPPDKFAATLSLRNISALCFDDSKVDLAIPGLPNLANFGLRQYATLEPPLNAPATGLNIKQVILTATCKDEDQQWLNRCALLRLLPRLDVLDLYSVRNTLETDEFEAWSLYSNSAVSALLSSVPTVKNLRFESRGLIEFRPNATPSTSLVQHTQLCKLLVVEVALLGGTAAVPQAHMAPKDVLPANIDSIQIGYPSHRILPWLAQIRKPDFKSLDHIVGGLDL
jgi:hypothetical protein